MTEYLAKEAENKRLWKGVKDSMIGYGIYGER
jgi:hypothetical protein